MKRLIINADDFGLTPGVNRAIIRAYQDGVLTSATLMAGGLAWQEAVELARANPGLGVGVHLTLTALKPVLPASQVPTLTDKQGRFRRQFWRAPLWNREQVAKEWRGQILRLQEAGLRPTHLDSHHHIHLWPGLTDIFCSLAKEFKLSAVRLISPLSFKIMGIGGWQRHICERSWRRGQGNSLAKPDSVAGMEAFSLTREGIETYLHKLPTGVHELYCHPGSAGDSALAGISSLREKRIRETDALCSSWFKEILAEEGIVPVNYNYFGEERV